MAAEAYFDTPGETCFFFSECPVYATQMDWQFVACQLRVGGRVMVAESSKQFQLGFYVVSWGDRS